MPYNRDVDVHFLNRGCINRVQIIEYVDRCMSKSVRQMLTYR